MGHSFKDTHNKVGPASITLSTGRVIKSLPGRGKVDNEVETWRDAMEKGIDLLARLHSTKTIHGEVWLAKMKAYYRMRVERLLKDRPHGCEDAAALYQDRISKL